MRRVVTTLFFSMVIVAPAFAADEFGARFGNSAPAALDEPKPANPDALAFTPEQLQGIETAAGEGQQVPEMYGPDVPTHLLQKNPAPSHQ